MVKIKKATQKALFPLISKEQQNLYKQTNMQP